MRSTGDRAEQRQLLDWGRVGRRVGWSAAVLLGLSVLAWLGIGLARGGPSLSDLGGYLGLAFAGMFVAELVFVGGAALRAMLRAGEHGERLAGGDVGLLPPQVSRWLRRGR